MLATWSTVATIFGIVVTALLAWLTIKATRKSTKDSATANELAARDRLIDQRDHFIDQVQEERDRLSNQLHDALDRIDILTGHTRTLEEQLAALKRRVDDPTT